MMKNGLVNYKHIQLLQIFQQLTTDSKIYKIDYYYSLDVIISADYTA